MSPVQTIIVSTRRVLARRPWIQWVAIVTVAVATAFSVQARLDRVDAQRDSWGATRTVLVAAESHEIGQALQVELRELPTAMIPDRAIDDRGELASGAVARQRIGAGEVLTRLDLAADSGPQAMTPAGWLAVPVVESPQSGAAIGDRVQVASDGFVLSVEAVVVGLLDGVTVIAVPAAEAALLPVAANAGSLTLLLEP